MQWVTFYMSYIVFLISNILKLFQLFKYMLKTFTTLLLKIIKILGCNIIVQYIDVIRKRFMPNKFLLKTKEDGQILIERNEVMKSLIQAGESTPSVHICENFICGMPIRDLRELEEKWPYCLGLNGSSLVRFQSNL